MSVSWCIQAVVFIGVPSVHFHLQHLRGHKKFIHIWNLTALFLRKMTQLKSRNNQAKHNCKTYTTMLLWTYYNIFWVHYFKVICCKYIRNYIIRNLPWSHYLLLCMTYHCLMKQKWDLLCNVVSWISVRISCLLCVMQFAGHCLRIDLIPVNPVDAQPLLLSANLCFVLTQKSHKNTKATTQHISYYGSEQSSGPSGRTEEEWERSAIYKFAMLFTVLCLIRDKDGLGVRLWCECCSLPL